MKQVYTIYLDACCLNRPFDDQNQDRIRMETESIIILLKNVRKGKIHLIGSDVLKLEINKTPNPIRKSQLLTLLHYYSKFLPVNEKIKTRSTELAAMGFSAFDAYHIAFAEKGEVDAFLTTDDKIITLYSRNSTSIFTKVLNPISWLQEFL